MTEIHCDLSLITDGRDVTHWPDILLFDQKRGGDGFNYCDRNRPRA